MSQLRAQPQGEPAFGRVRTPQRDEPGDAGRSRGTARAAARRDGGVSASSDLGALQSSTLGKLEIESLEDGEDEEVVDKLINAAILQTFREHCPPETLGQVVGAFEDGNVVHIGPDISSLDYVGVLDQLPALRTPVWVLTAESESLPAIASAIAARAGRTHSWFELASTRGGGRAIAGGPRQGACARHGLCGDLTATRDGKMAARLVSSTLVGRRLCR